MTERMRIAASYFQRLIEDTPASDAVRAIAGMWHPRVTQVEPWFGLSLPEHNVQMVLIYTGEVGNGGHTQFFQNRAGRIVSHVHDALAELRLIELSELLRDAVALFPDAVVPQDPDAVERVVDSWDDEVLERVAALDRRASGTCGMSTSSSSTTFDATNATSCARSAASSIDPGSENYGLTAASRTTLVSVNPKSLTAFASS
jgi:hypothetical protein